MRSIRIVRLSEAIRVVRMSFIEAEIGVAGSPRFE
jgi:hypothetical protein